MKHIHYLSASLLIPALMGLSSCVSTDQPEQEGAPVVEQQSNHREDYTNVIPGTLVVKLTPEQLASYRKADRPLSPEHSPQRRRTGRRP